MSSKRNKVKKTLIKSRDAYQLVAPQSQAVLAGSTLYVSGLLGMDAAGQLVCGGAEAQTHKVFDNLKYILAAGGSSLDHVIKVTIMLDDFQNFKLVNQVYCEYFQKNYPARIAFEAGKLPCNAAVEVEVIALSGELVVGDAGPCPCLRK